MRLLCRQTAGAGSRWRTELLGGAASLTLGLVVLAHLAASPRAWVLFYDGDSLLFPLVNASIRAGQAQHWNLTSPLFLAEVAIYVPLGALGLPVQATLLLDGLVNWIALYAVVRVVSSLLRVQQGVRVTVSVAAVAVFSLFTLLESSASHDALEPASLMATSTYYSGTVIAVLGAVALTASAYRRQRTRWSGAALGGLVGFAVLSNPLFIAWAVIPLLVVLALTLLTGARPRSILASAAALVGGSAAGMLARIPFQSLLVQDSAAKIRPDLVAQSAAYYGGLLHDRLTTDAGVLELALLLAVLGLAATMLVLAIRERWTVGTVIAGTAFVGPLLVTGGAIALGTFASRYLEPVLFLPPLALLTTPHLLPTLTQRFTQTRITPAIAAVGATFAATLTMMSVVSLGLTASHPTPAVACAAKWVATHDQYGAGQYWTIRAIKAYSPDPRRLIQTDADAAPYAWLSNTADLSQHSVTYSINSSASAPLGPAFPQPQSVTKCGDFTIATYTRAVRLGTPHH